MAEQQQAGRRVGLEFTETMRGYFSTAEKDDFQRAHDEGRRGGSPLEFTVTVTSDDLDELLESPDHPARLSGTVTAPALSKAPLKVRDGRFNLFVKDPDRPMTRRMRYGMPLEADDGRRYYLDGYKLIHDDSCGLDVWHDTTTLNVTVHEGDDAEGPVAGRGIVKILMRDFRRQLASMRVLDAKDNCERLKALARFGGHFGGVLGKIYGGVFAPSSTFDPDAPPRERRPLRCGEPQVHPVETADGTALA